MPSVCLITPGHIASTPRLVKEADALAAAGYRVHVVAGRHYPPVGPLDDALLERASWHYTAVRPSRGAAGVWRKLTRRASRLVIGGRLTTFASTAAWALQAETSRLARAAAGTGADLFLGHCVAGLAAAALASTSRAGRLGFDAEDFHDEESTADTAMRRATEIIQGAYLRRSLHLTAASPLIAAQYREKYDVDAAVVLNTFPLSEAPPAPVVPGPINAGNPARFYWFSQTIGPGRGLEHFLGILARMRTPARLELRGFVGDAYRASLEGVAADMGVPNALRFLPPAPPAEMVRLAATAHVGLSLEQPTPRNRDLCLTNKVFTYLLAGVPQLLTPTTAQARIARDLGVAALLASSDPAETARLLDDLFARPDQYEASRAHAWRLGHERYCWDIEQRIFLAIVSRVLPVH